MIRRTPSEPEWASWLLFALWTSLIFASIPLAPRIQDFVEAAWGRPSFAWAVVALAAVGMVGAVVLARRSGTASPAGTAWLLGVGASLVGGVYWLRDDPEEALHFVEYAVLGLLAYRALCHRVQDATVYASAALVTAMVGLVDEAVQWLVPDRYWGLRDLGIDALAGTLAQVAIGKGLRPVFVAAWPTPRGVRILCRIALAATLLLGASLLNTPARIGWYASRVPFLEYLKTNESVMLEYGYRYVDPVGGPFKSRLTLAELARADRERAKEAAAILDRYPTREDYKRFLELYTPVSDPFVHEARVHLFRRDLHRTWAAEPDKTDYERRVHVTVALRENALLERHFTETLARSSHVLPADEIEELRAHALPESELPAREVESRVSLDLITAVGEGQIMAVLASLIVALWLVQRRVRDRDRGEASETR